MCVHCNRSQMTSQSVNKKVRDEVEWRDCCSLHDLLQYTHTDKFNVFVLYNKNSNDFLGHEKRKTSLLTWI